MLIAFLLLSVADALVLATFLAIFLAPFENVGAEEN